MQGRLRLDLFVWLVLQEEVISFCKNQRGAIIMKSFFNTLLYRIIHSNLLLQFCGDSSPVVGSEGAGDLPGAPDRAERCHQGRRWPGVGRRLRTEGSARRCLLLGRWLRGLRGRCRRQLPSLAVPTQPCLGPCISKCWAAGANQVVGNACIRFAPAKEMSLILLQIYPIMRSICYRT